VANGGQSFVGAGGAGVRASGGASGVIAVHWDEQQLLRTSGIAEIDGMDGVTFERYLEALFRRLGYNVQRIGMTGDFGADLIVNKDGMGTIVQAKRYAKSVVSLRQACVDRDASGAVTQKQ
jgi:restriction endonuclease Mrr